MLKSIVLGFIFINYASGFSYNMQLLNNKNDKPVISLKRRDCIKVMPFIVAPFLSAKLVSAEEKSIEQLREEANRIIEIIDAQKEAFNLPTLKKSNNLINTNSTSNMSNNEVEKVNKDDKVEHFNAVLDNVMLSFKNNDAYVSIENLKLHCASSNPLKSQNTNYLIETFNNSKYAILLGKFYNYSYVNYKYEYDKEFKKYQILGEELDLGLEDAYPYNYVPIIKYIRTKDGVLHKEIYLNADNSIFDPEEVTDIDGFYDELVWNQLNGMLYTFKSEGLKRIAIKKGFRCGVYTNPKDILSNESAYKDLHTTETIIDANGVVKRVSVKRSDSELD